MGSPYVYGQGKDSFRKEVKPESMSHQKRCAGAMPALDTIDLTEFLSPDCVMLYKTKLVLRSGISVDRQLALCSLGL